MVAGLLGFGELYPHVQGFMQITSMGQITLPRLFNLPYGLLVFAVVLMALGAFAAAEWAEKKFGGKEPEPLGSLTARPWQWSSVRILAVALAAAGFIAVFAGDPYRGSHVTIDTRDLALRAATGADTVQPAQVADWIIQGRNDFALIDLRSPKDFAAYHIPTAQNLPLASLTPNFLPHNEKIVLCSSDGTDASKAWFLLSAQGFKAVYLLNGGIRSWQDNVLFPVKPAGLETAAFERQALVAKFFGGAHRTEATASPAVMQVSLPQPAPVAAPALPAASTSAAPQPHKKKEGC